MMQVLGSALGQFYFAEHSNSPPTFVQVVGWTKGAENPDAKRRYVYVRKVPLIVNHSCIGTGGSWEFNFKIIKKYSDQIKTPIQKNIKELVDGNAIIIDNHFLRYQSKTLTLKLFDFIPLPVDITKPLYDQDYDTAIAAELDKDSDNDSNKQFSRLQKLVPL